MSKSLADWLSNPERTYEDGLVILKTLIPLQAPMLIQLTKRPNMDKLMYELQKREGKAVDKIPKPTFGPKPLAQKAKILIKSGLDLSEVNFYELSELERAQVKRGQLANERNALANQLADLTSKEQRKIVRGRLRDLQTEIEAQSKIVFRLERGEDKLEKPVNLKRQKVLDNDPYKAVRAEINNIRAHITNRNKRIRRVSILDIPEAERKAQLKVLQNEIAEFQAKLNEKDKIIHELRYGNGQSEEA